jgi:hypothetical protein
MCSELSKGTHDVADKNTTPEREYWEDADLYSVGHDFLMEHRLLESYPDVETIFWFEPSLEVIAVIKGRLNQQEGKQFAGGYSLGFRRGQDKGENIGQRRGFAACQAGFRALLGAGSQADVETLLQSAKSAKDANHD